MRPSLAPLFSNRGEGYETFIKFDDDCSDGTLYAVLVGTVMKIFKNPLICTSLMLCLASCQPQSTNNGNGSIKQNPENKKEIPPEILSLNHFLEESFFPIKTKQILTKGLQDAVLYSVPVSNQTIQNAQQAYIIQYNKTAESMGILNASKEGLNYLLSAAATGSAALGVTVPQAMAIELVNKGLTDTLEYGISEFEKKSHSEAAKILADRLRRSSAKDLKEFNSLKGLPPAEALVKAERLANSWFLEKDFSNIPAEQRAEARAITSSWVARTALAKLAEHISASEIIQTNLSSDIEQSKTELFKLGKTLKVFAINTQKSLESIAQAQQSITRQIESLTMESQLQGSKLQEMSDDISFIKEFAFSRMTAREQLNAFKREAMKAEMTAEIRSKIALLEDKVAFEEGYKSYYQGAQNLLTIASNLGVNAGTLKGIAEGIEKVDRLKNGIENIVQGQYLAGVASLSGLFGGRSAEDAKHKEILQKLNLVLENQKIISDQIAQSFELQMEALGKLSNQIRLSTELLYSKMDKVHSDVLTNRIILNQILSSNLKSCKVAAENIQKRTLLSSFSNLTFKRHLESCAMEYDKIFGLKEFTPYFSLNSYNSPLVKDFVEQDEANYFDVYSYLYSKFRSNYNLTAALFNPSENAFGLIQKTRVLRSMGAPYISDLSNQFKTLQVRLYAPAVIQNVQRMISLLPALNILHASKTETISLTTIAASKDKMGQEELELVNSALELVNLSLAQESLMAGEGSLESLYEDFDQLQEEKESGPNPAKEMVSKNKIIFKNFIAYSIYREFLDQKLSLLTYKQQLQTAKDVKGFSSLFKKKWNITWDNAKSKYFISVAGVTMAMPSYEEVVQSKLEFSDSVPLLLQTREDLLQLKTEMEMSENLNSADIKVLHQILLR